jgi:hypothetical protein
MRPEELGKLIKFNYLAGSRTQDQVLYGLQETTNTKVKIFRDQGRVRTGTFVHATTIHALTDGLVTVPASA